MPEIMSGESRRGRDPAGAHAIAFDQELDVGAVAEYAGRQIEQEPELPVPQRRPGCRKERLWRTAMKRKGRVSEKQTANDDRDERNDIAFTRFGVDVDIDGVPERGKADYLDEIIEPVLDIDVFRAPDMSILINLQNVTRMPP